MGNYLPSTLEQRLEMLHAMGFQSIDELFQDLPKDMLFDELNIPAGISELEIDAYIRKIASKNKVYTSIFRGAGAYNHYIPSIVKRMVAKEEFVTAYTPYQAEISQGILQAIFEYQTMICTLTGMDVSNASVYDGATAAAEALSMCRERKRNKVVISGTSHPDVIETVKTYARGNGMECVVLAEKEGLTDIELLEEQLEKDVAAVYVQQPNYYGSIEEAEKIGELTHAVGAKFIMGVNPIATAILKTPGECGADVAVGDGQPLGIPISFGGPYLGFMAVKSAMTRKLPGRIVGETVDKDGRRCFVLTLQAREQHIRREKSASNICSNQALCAFTASVYMTAMGPHGLQEAATQCYEKAHYLAKELEAMEGFAIQNKGEFFHEFVTSSPVDTEKLMKALDEKGILGGLPVEGGILWCVTEKNSKESIDELISAIKEVCSV